MKSVLRKEVGLRCKRFVKKVGYREPGEKERGTHRWKTSWQALEEESHKERDWCEADGEKSGIDCRDVVRHTEPNDQSYVTRMIQVSGLQTVQKSTFT